MGGIQGSDIGVTPGEEEYCNRGRENATAPADVERRESGQAGGYRKGHAEAVERNTYT